MLINIGLIQGLLKDGQESSSKILNLFSVNEYVKIELNLFLASHYSKLQLNIYIFEAGQPFEIYFSQ